MVQVLRGIRTALNLGPHLLALYPLVSILGRVSPMGTTKISGSKELGLRRNYAFAMNNSLLNTDTALTKTHKYIHLRKTQGPLFFVNPELKALFITTLVLFLLF